MTLPILVKDGILYSSLEPLPEKPEIVPLSPVWNTANERQHQEALSQWRIEVEDQKSVMGKLKCHESGWPNDVDCDWSDCPAKDGSCPLWHPGYPSDEEDDGAGRYGVSQLKDGLYFIEVKEAKVVELPVNCNCTKPCESFNECQYRKVIRITP